MNTLSARRIVLALLDAHGGPMSPEDVVAGVTARARWHTLTADSAKFQQRGSPIVVDDQGRWAIAPDAAEALKAARGAVRQRLDHASPSAQAAADLIAYEVRREARRAELAKLRHVVAYAYPPGGPGALALLDIEAHTIDTFLGDEITAAPRPARRLRRHRRPRRPRPPPRDRRRSGRPAPRRARAPSEVEEDQQERPHPQDHGRPLDPRHLRDQPPLRPGGLTKAPRRRRPQQGAPSPRGRRQVPRCHFDMADPPSRAAGGDHEQLAARVRSV
jgi:hypothetical protein